MTDAIPHRDFLGIRFTPMPLGEALDRITARDPEAPFAYVVTPNAHHTVGAYRGDPRFLRGQRNAWLVLNDSRILRQISLRLFGRDLPLAPGSDMTAALFARGVDPDTPVVMIGGGAEVEAALRSRFGLRNLHRHNPPMGFHRYEAEMAGCVAFVQAHPARYVFLVAGAPQSELLAARIAAAGGARGVGLCVGSALNFLTGVQPRAPWLWRAANLEWLYRLLRNPRGHFRRVFLESFPVLWIALRQRLSLGR